MFSVFGSTEARRLPGASQFPWREIGLGLIVLALLAVAALGVREIVSRVQNGNAPAPAVQVVEQQVAVPVVPAAIQPVAQPVQQAPQSVQENIGAAAPVVVEWPEVEMVWEATNISNRSPNSIAAIPVEEGLYNGDSFNTTNDTQRWEERRAFADKILPQLGLKENNGVAVAAVRSGDVTFVHIEADSTVIPLLLSMDGGNTWCELTKVPPKTPADVGRQSHNLRIQVDGDTLHLYATDSSVGVWWWTATVKKNELPCS